MVDRTAPDASVTALVAELAGRAKTASRRLALLSRADKDAALHAIADALDAAIPAVVQANADDLTQGRERGMAEGLLDRLMLDEARIRAIAEAVREVAALPDPVGEVVRGSTLANGLQIRQVRVPMGVVGMIYEARPNVTVDAAALGLKSGNAVILRGGSAAAASNRALVAVIRAALAERGLPEDAVTLIEVPALAISSTDCRDRVRGHEPIWYLVPDGIVQYIAKRGLYPAPEAGVPHDRT